MTSSSKRAVSLMDLERGTAERTCWAKAGRRGGTSIHPEPEAGRDGTVLLRGLANATPTAPVPASCCFVSLDFAAGKLQSSSILGSAETPWLLQQAPAETAKELKASWSRSWKRPPRCTQWSD